MKKIIVIGCPGSGKTIFANKLNRITGIPLYHLDTIWHKPDRTHISREDFDKILTNIFDTPEWIIDGNYSRTVETRLCRCDTVFLFDLPTEVCIQGAADMIVSGRYELPWTENELSDTLKKEIEDFPLYKLPRIYELIGRYEQGKQIVVFKSREEADAFLQTIS